MEESGWKERSSRRKTAATSSSTPSRPKRIEPAPLGPDTPRMGGLRHPSSGPYVLATSRVLPFVSDGAWRISDGGAKGTLRHSRLREQVPLVRPWRPRARRERQRPYADGSRARNLRGRRVLGRPRRDARDLERTPHRKPHRGLSRPLQRAWSQRRGRLRLHLREQGRGHWCDSAPSARPDLRLPIHPPASCDGAGSKPRVQGAKRRPLPALRPPLPGARGRPPGIDQGRALHGLHPVLRPLPLRGPRLLPALRALDSRPARRRTSRPGGRTQAAARGLRFPFQLLAPVHDGHAPGPDGRRLLRQHRPLPHRVLPAEPDRGQAEVPRGKRDRGGRLHHGRPAREDRRDPAREDREPMRVLVTGGAGYIGSVVASQLIEEGHETVVLDNLSKGHGKAVPEGARLVQGNLMDADFTRETLSEGFDGVLHFAALSLVGESVEQPERYYRNNVCGTLNLLEAMREAGTGRLVFSSTAAVYGEPEEVPIQESAPALPTNPYGSSKLAVDRLIGAVCGARGLAATSLRYFNVAGAAGRFGEDHHPETHLIPLVLRAAAEGSSVKIFGTDYPTRDGTAVRDYIHVEDLGRAHLLALEAAEPGEHSVYNLGNGAGFSVREVVEAARRVTGKSIDAVEAPRRAGDPPTLVASSEKIQADLGWKPEKPELETMISDAWTWMQDHPNGYE